MKRIPQEKYDVFFDEAASTLIRKSLPFIETIRKTYQQLSVEERKVIDNEFFFKKYPLWWKSYYSAISYKKLKYKSMAHFLEVFYDTVI